MDGTHAVIRTQETKLGNFIADIVAAATKADIVLINSGSFRSDRVFPAGDFQLYDLMSILSIVGTVVTVQITGAQVLEALENGVCKYPKHDGRFPQVRSPFYYFPSHIFLNLNVRHDIIRTKYINISSS